MIDTAQPDRAPRIAFIPVSGRFGMGEYARSLAIARATRTRWPRAEIHFMLSREAPYAVQAPFPATLLPASATFHSDTVIAWLHEWRPTVVIFDNAGRTSQLRAARDVGAKVVYISARRRQRRKAFRWRWMRMLDEHWIAYPAFIAGRLHWYEKFKLRWVGRPALRFLDVIMSRGDALRGATMLSAAGCSPNGFVLLVPGGGTGHPGAEAATVEFLEAARKLAADGVPSVFVGPVVPCVSTAATALQSEPTPAARSSLTILGLLPQADLAQWMQNARLVVANGGSTLLQAVANARPCIAVAIAGDQATRIERCVASGVAVAASADATHIASLAAGLWANAPDLDAMAERARALQLADGIEVALAALGRLIAGDA